MAEGNTASDQTAGEVERTIKPLYLKNGDLQFSEGKRVSDYDLMDPVMSVIGDNLHCIQLDRNLWRIYVKTKESRQKLLTQGIDINNMSVSFYDTNPYSSGATSVDQKTLKIRICGLPLSVDESAVHELLNKLNVKLVSKVMYEKIRHPETNRMTSVLNGTRFMYIEPLPNGENLPRNNSCAGLRCQIFHFGQPKHNRSLLCTKCWNTDHTRSRCKNEECCKICQKPGHKPGDKDCEYFETQKNLTMFSGSDDILSNFYPCEIDIFGIKHKSAEHAFHYAKALRCGDLDAANNIKEAEDAVAALRFGNKIKDNEQWTSTKTSVMEEILENKCVQVPGFCEKLRTTKLTTTFVATIYDNEWGSGLDQHATVNTKQTKWPGKNLLGTMVKTIAKKCRKRKLSDQWSRGKQKSSQREASRQLDIVKMLRDLRAPASDSEGYTHDNETSDDETVK